MSIRSTIDILKNNLDSYVIKDNAEMCKIVLRAKTVVFLDTCFMSSLLKFDELSLSDLLERIVGERGSKSIVLVITEMVLYESRDSRDNTVQQFIHKIVDLAKENNIPVVLLSEESFYKELQPYFSRSHEEWNKLFLERLKENKANLIKILGLISSDKEQLFDDTFVVSSAKAKDKELICESIQRIKERKSDKDSLAEELICVVIFFLLDIFLSSNKRKIIFCSNDNRALAIVKMTLATSYGNRCTCFENIHLFMLIQYMVKNKLLNDKQEVIELLRKNMAEELWVVEQKDLPYVETEQKMNLKEIVDGIFEGKVYQYKGNH